MQRLRSTFKRSRTPTGAEMKSQSSLEVPKQVRSASFDEIQLEAKKQDLRHGPSTSDSRSPRTTSSSSSSCSPARSTQEQQQQQQTRLARRSATLKVPQLHSGQRSKSFDVYERKVDRLGARQRSVRGPETPTIQLSGCYHCACVEEYAALSRNSLAAAAAATAAAAAAAKSPWDYDTDDDDVEDEGNEGDVEQEDREDEDEEELDYESDGESSYCSPREGSPEIRVTLTVPLQPPVQEFPQVGQRRRSVASPKLARQEALTSFPLELPRRGSRENERKTQDIEDDEEEHENFPSRQHEDDYPSEDLEDIPGEQPTERNLPGKPGKLVVRDIFLTVPELKRDRAASVDSCFDSKNGKKDESGLLTVPQQSARSKSVDIVLPTEAQTRYTALLPGSADDSGPQGPARGGRQEAGSGAGQREPRSTPDWGATALNGEHLWVPTAASGDFCYVNDCSKHGPRMKCAACRVVAHAVCAGNLSFACKSSFRDVGVRQYREQTTTHHHWVHRRSQKGKCANCGKSFQSKLSFTSKEIVAVSCSWCKKAYHNKEACFDVQRIGENCELGTHASIIVPPAWIVKLPRKGSFKSSLRKSPRKKKSSGGGPGASSRRKPKEKDKEQDKDQGRLWVVKPIPTATIKPVLVFINPKSGGNQGAKLLQKFQWLLNPRQVFDLTQGGPKMGLELFKKVPNLRVLACGGDGTVGWVLSILDQIGANPPPAVGVLPLGTGNDLARALGWGGGYTDEPIGKILTNIGESDTTLLDRWQLQVERNNDAQNDDDAGKGKENLPLNVVNNYFSLGVDAYIALEFHEAREAHPEKFNSRLRNKMYYGQMGGKDLVRRKWKDLSEFVTLECDGQDMTAKLKEHRVHAIVFLNIASYGGGTHPWGAGSGTKEPSTEDGLIEVVGLTTYQLPLLQAGGHGTCIAQCSKAKLVTTRTIPMQVDGEACRLLPSVINLSLLNQATMLAKRRNAGKSQPDVAKLERLKLPVMRIKMSDYEAHHSDKDRLKSAAVMWLPEPVDLDATTDLESLRKILAKDHNMDTCCFLDSCTAERFFRVDRGQEQLHYVTDVAVEAVYVLDEAASGRTSAEPPSTGNVAPPEPETARPSPSEDRRKLSRAEKSREEAQSPAETQAPTTPVDDQPALQKQPTQRSRDFSSNQQTLPKSESYRKEQISQETMGKHEKFSDKHSSSGKSTAESSSVQPHHSHQPTSAFISPRDRLFGLGAEVHTFSTGLLERTCDEILKAAKIGDLQALKYFHDKGYSLLSIDSTGQTALHLASRHGHKDIVRYLIACAPPTVLNMVDNDKGQTALHKAAQQKRRSICSMLVAGGATLTVKDRQGNTPRQLALIAEDRELAAYLHSQEQFQLVTEEAEDTAL